MAEKSDKTSNDKELDDLLDSALEDFEKNKETPTPATKDLCPDPVDEVWNEEFIASQAKLFEQSMMSLFSGAAGGQPGAPADPTPEQMAMGFERIREAATLAMSSNADEITSVDPQFSQSIKDALKGLSEGQENLQTPFSPEDIAGMFGNIDLNEGGDSNAFLPFMQGMMQSLLSAEILLPSLKDLVEKYPAWLEENGTKISAEDKDRYEKQLQIMKNVCGELESEKESDSADVKKDRFNKVLEEMQKIHELGQPPKDLIGDVDGAGLPNFDPTAMGAMGAMGADPSQCSLM